MIEEDRGTVRAVAWTEIFPWLILFRCFRISVGVRPLLISVVAALATLFGWWAVEWVFSGNDTVGQRRDNGAACPWETLASVAGPQQDGLGEPQLFAGGGDSSLAARSSVATFGTWSQLSRPFVEGITLNLGVDENPVAPAPFSIGPGYAPDDSSEPAAVESPFQAGKLAYSLLCALWGLFVWSFAGAAITRDAALQLTIGERIGWSAAIGHARDNWRAYAWAPLLPYLGVLFAMFAMALLGILMKLNLRVLMVAIVWPLLLLVGVLLVLLAVGVLFGWPLMFATIGVEGTDSFDALSRAYSYVYQRPLHLLFYAAVATALGLLGWLFVSLFAHTVLALTQGAVCWGSGGEFRWDGKPIPHLVYVFASGESTAHLGSIGAFVIRCWSDCVRLTAVGFLYSFFWVSATAGYLLLRKAVDDTELDEVFVEEDDEEMLSLPEISQDEQGAPVVDDAPPADELR